MSASISYLDISAHEAMVPVLPTVHFPFSKFHIGYEIQADVIWNGLKIPRGFTYDGATVPQVFWAITGGPFHPRVMKAALVHDWYYLTRLVDQKEADDVLARLLKEWGTHHWKVEMFYKSVATLGCFYYPRSERDTQHLLYWFEELEKRGIDPQEFRLVEAWNNA